MAGRGSRTNGSGDQQRALAERLRARSAELEEAIFDRIWALEAAASSDAPSLHGLRKVIRAATEHGIAAVELGERRAPSPPPEAIAHARQAAWASMPVQTLYERYFAGYSVFTSYLLQETQSVQPTAEVLRQVHGSTNIVFGRLARVIRQEHEQEFQIRNRSSEAVRLDRVKELLSGELMEAPELDYPFDATHIGLVASGPDIAATIRQLAKSAGGRLLLVRVSPDKVWTWISDTREVLDSCFAALESLQPPTGTRICIGEPAVGLRGWRDTHRQARSAFDFSARGTERVVRYSDVALLASIAKDDLLMRSLQDLYLTPLAAGNDRWEVHRETLRAYFAADGNRASAASALGVSRQTVGNNLRAVEERLGKPLGACAEDLAAALRLEALGWLAPLQMSTNSGVI